MSKHIEQKKKFFKAAAYSKGDPYYRVWFSGKQSLLKSQLNKVIFK